VHLAADALDALSRFRIDRALRHMEIPQAHRREHGATLWSNQQQSGEHFMRALRSVLVLALSFAGVAAAGDFDGAVPLTCKVEKAHDCLPTSQCSPLKPETNIEPVYGIDFAKKEVRSPFRTATMAILHTAKNDDSIVLQGADLRIAWSAMVDRKTGDLTVALGDSKGAYVAFGKCAVATKNTKK
jgi:hypothetical protein